MAAAAAAAAVAAVTIGAVMFAAGPSGRSTAAHPHATELLAMWDRPYHTQTTTMLWNAASDDAGMDNSNSDSDDSAAYTQFDTFGHSASLSAGDSGNDEGYGGDSGETELADSDSFDDDNSEDSYDNSDSSYSDISVPDTHVHSWDSANSAALKQQLRKMFSKGINKVSKEVAAKAEKTASAQGFYGKWAKGLTSKSNKKEFGMDKTQRKLYKEAETSVLKDQAKKAPLIKAVKQAAEAAKKAHKDHGLQTQSKVEHDEHVKAKLKVPECAYKSAHMHTYTHTRTHVHGLTRLGACDRLPTGLPRNCRGTRARPPRRRRASRRRWRRPRRTLERSVAKVP